MCVRKKQKQQKKERTRRKRNGERGGRRGGGGKWRLQRGAEAGTEEEAHPSSVAGSTAEATSARSSARGREGEGIGQRGWIRGKAGLGKGEDGASAWGAWKTRANTKRKRKRGWGRRCPGTEASLGMVFVRPLCADRGREGLSHPVAFSAAFASPHNSHF